MAATLTGTIRKAPGNEAWANAPYTIRLVRPFALLAGGAHPTYTRSGFASALGLIDEELATPATGTAHYELGLSDGRRITLHVADGDAVTVEAAMLGAYGAPESVTTTAALLAAQTLGAHADVTTAGATDGQALVYDATLGLWLPGTVAGGGAGGWSVADNGDGTLTITGSSVTDNGDGTLTIG